MSVPPTHGVHHITLSVTDVERSAAWYEALLGEAQRTNRAGDGWQRIRMSWPNGLIIGVTAHDATAANDEFDTTRVGLDHLGLACTSEDDVRAWAQRIDSLGFQRGPVEDVPYGWAVTTRDPDDIAVEFFCSRSA